MSKTLTLIRHGQSTFNAWGSQERDCPLTETGAVSCKNISGAYDLVICSPLRRAQQTLVKSMLSYSEVLFTELCREIKAGNPTDYYIDEKLENETPEQIQTRITAFKDLVKELQKKHEKIAIISHSTFLWHFSGSGFHNAEMRDYKLI